MRVMPKPVEEFLATKRIAVAGVSRQGNQPANLIFRRLRDSGHEVFPVNPKTATVEGVTCYSDLAAVPGPVDAVMVATHPDVSADIVRQAVARGVRHVWFHRSFGSGSVSDEAVHACREHGVEPIVGGCPMMFCEPVDVGHACMRWWLQRRGRVPR
jgi:predicted CoA-binding protein